MQTSVKKIIEQSLFLILVSALSAAFSTAFLLSLNYFFGLFTENLWLIFGLPFFGVFTLWLYQKLSRHLSTSHLHFEGITDYRAESAQNLGWGSALLVLVASSLSQLFGASTGREGAAIQYGASLGSATAELQWWAFKHRDYDLLVRAGMVAGFSSLFGTPLAALVFLGERFGFKQPWDQSLQWALVAYLSFYFSEIFMAPHSSYPAWPVFNWDAPVLLSLIVLFVVIFIMAFLYKKTMALFFHLGFTLIHNSYLRILAAGLLLGALTWAVGSSRYNGLGVPLIQQSFSAVSAWYDPILKSLFTLISVTAGFKGGEVTPLMSIGAALGSFVSPWLSLPLIAASAMGCIFFFAQVLGIPLTGAILMIELFGESSAPVALSCGVILWAMKRFHPLRTF